MASSFFHAAVREVAKAIIPSASVDASLTDYGALDSLGAVEFRSRLSQQLDVDVDGSNAVTLDEFEDFFVSCAEGKPPPRRKAMSLNQKKATKREKREAARKAEMLGKSQSGTALPAIGGAHGGAADVRRGQPAPGLQRLMQTSFTDTWPPSTPPPSAPRSPLRAGNVPHTSDLRPPTS